MCVCVCVCVMLQGGLQVHPGAPDFQCGGAGQGLHSQRSENINVEQTHRTVSLL